MRQKVLPWIVVVIFFGLIVAGMYFTYRSDNYEPIAMYRQAYFRIDVNNEVMIEAYRYHNIDHDGIFWDVTNDTFMFSRDGHNCFVFTADFKKYLDDKEYQKE